MCKVILASKSPRRIELLEKNGIKAVSMPADIIEDVPVIGDYKDTVMHLALKKAMAIYENGDIKGYDIIIGSDTVVYNDKILGKPYSKKDAYEMIKSISGKSHLVVTGIALIDIKNDLKYVSYDITEVYVKELTEEEISEYISSDEPYDKAGAYAIQGEFGKHIEKYLGSYTNVMGLPMEKLKEMMKLI